MDVKFEESMNKTLAIQNQINFLSLMTTNISEKL